MIINKLLFTQSKCQLCPEALVFNVFQPDIMMPGLGKETSNLRIRNLPIQLASRYHALAILLLLILQFFCHFHAEASAKDSLLLKINATSIYYDKQNPAVYFTAGMAIDADGSPRAYHPADTGLDYLRNAGRPGHWYGIVIAEDTPVIQGGWDPNPGYYVSSTSLQDYGRFAGDPLRYVNSETIPYIALPKALIEKAGYKLGDIGVAWNTKNDSLSFFIFADIGPANKIGEGSMALAAALGIRNNPRNGGVENGIFYLLFPKSGNGKVKMLKEINKVAADYFKRWGGKSALKLRATKK